MLLLLIQKCHVQNSRKPVLTGNRQAALAQDVGPALTAGRETDVAKFLPVYGNVHPQCIYYLSSYPR
jgi:hypothetical protein